ncbi:hypothetical protein [Actinobacillus equuli]|uniref:hypothetical protein n=1 Tax=Actinobacillus equuli TaxID=718 RepID=UPI0024412587|nr:hypothetical protein [Actinobacillus equuli]WGE43111.1 hypothetical protein NYR64_04530 [Actinobacillus equuli subsp. haemolyticus]WGE46903.1 hypothetical protein NYR84_01515 [Actinobacillus equuli subsp. haemolyticus]
MLKIIPKSCIFLGLSLVTLAMVACSKPSFREEFFKQRHCPEVRYQCLPESQEKKMIDLSQPYQLSDEEEARIARDDTLRMYQEIAKMLEIYYPGFWRDTDEKTQLAWMEKVDELTKRYYGENRMRAELEIMASVCAIIGLNFEADPKLAFVVQKLKEDDYVSLGEINSYLRFEVLQKDYDEAGNQYNNWSLRGVRQGTPPMTRHVPDFNTEWKPYNPNENVERIYDRWLREKGKAK